MLGLEIEMTTSNDSAHHASKAKRESEDLINKTISDMLAMPAAADIDFDPEALKGAFIKPAKFDN